jgi:hypothetical protein
MDCIENTASISSSIVACVSVAAITQQPLLFIEPLLSNGYCIAAYFAVVAQQRVCMPQYKNLGTRAVAYEDMINKQSKPRK